MVCVDYRPLYSSSEGTTIELDENVYMIRISQTKLGDVRQTMNEDQ